ncbi:hypothetical protein M885DRAFT_538633 [Pelagophyceae sp. CCMP2097]|nr:hypothetical protein M885DRAFT_538633 [Pelagophyceae sp. CCMP2097]
MAAVRTTTTPAKAALILAAHLRSDAARRARHDFVVRAISALYREAEHFGRVHVDRPLFDVLGGATAKRSRRVDVVVDGCAGAPALLVEVTVLSRADAASLETATAVKEAKYADLGIETLVVAVDALTGALPKHMLDRLATSLGLADLDAFATQLSASLIRLALEPLARAAAKRPSTSRLHRRRAPRRRLHKAAAATTVQGSAPDAD